MRGTIICVVLNKKFVDVVSGVVEGNKSQGLAKKEHMNEEIIMRMMV